MQGDQVHYPMFRSPERTKISCLEHSKKMIVVGACITFHISISRCSSRGSMFVRTVPRKRVGSWGIIPNRARRSWRPMLAMSRLSMRILPPAGSTRRKSALIRVVFPLPVRPTTPILSPALKVHVMPFNTRGEVGLYRICSPDQFKLVSIKALLILRFKYHMPK
jgi:hypothetical protein